MSDMIQLDKLFMAAFGVMAYISILPILVLATIYFLIESIAADGFFNTIAKLIKPL